MSVVMLLFNADKKLMQSEVNLAAELALLLIDRLRSNYGGYRANQGFITHDQVYNCGQSNLETATYGLSLSGVCKVSSHNHCVFDLIVPYEETRDFITSQENLSVNAFEEILSAFVESYVSHDYALVPHRKYFLPRSDLVNPCRHLTICGFAESKGPKVRWTDKIAPVMNYWGLWDEDYNDVEEMEQVRMTTAATALLDSLPENVKKKLRDIQPPDD